MGDRGGDADARPGGWVVRGPSAACLRHGLAAAAVLAVAMVLGLAGLSPPAHAEDPAVSEVPLSGWRPDNGTVFALERVGSMVVVGGSFTRWRSPHWRPGDPERCRRRRRQHR